MDSRDPREGRFPSGPPAGFRENRVVPTGGSVSILFLVTHPEGMARYIFDTYHDVDGCPVRMGDAESPLVYYANKDGKPIITFGFDIFACHMAMRMLESYGIPYEIDGGRLNATAEQGMIDEVFEACTCLCEFYLNRITHLSDDSIGDIMVHIRFTLAWLLGIDPGSEKHMIPSTGRSTAVFYRVKDHAKVRKNGFPEDELRKILLISYNLDAVNEALESRTELTADDIVGNVEWSDGFEEAPSDNPRKKPRTRKTRCAFSLKPVCEAYYSTLLSDLRRESDHLMVSLDERISPHGDDDGIDNPLAGLPECRMIEGDRMIPLFALIDHLKTECVTGIGALSHHVLSDRNDIAYGKVCDDDALIGRKGERDIDLESTTHHLVDIVNNEETGRVLDDLIWFVRLLKCILSDSEIHDGHRVSFRFDPTSLMALLDPDLFGKSYEASPLYFVESEDLANQYNDLLSRISRKPEGHEHAEINYIESDVLKGLMNSWRHTTDNKNNPDRHHQSFCAIRNTFNVEFKKTGSGGHPEGDPSDDGPHQMTFERWMREKGGKGGDPKPMKRNALKLSWLSDIFTLEGFGIDTSSNEYFFKIGLTLKHPIEYRHELKVYKDDPLIFATRPEKYGELILKLGNPEFRKILPLIKFIVVVDASKEKMPAIIRNEYTLNLPVVTVSRLEDLLDVHTEYLFGNMLLAAEDTMKKNSSGESGFQKIMRDMIDSYCKKLMDFARNPMERCDRSPR